MNLSIEWLGFIDNDLLNEFLELIDHEFIELMLRIYWSCFFLLNAYNLLIMNLLNQRLGFIDLEFIYHEFIDWMFRIYWLQKPSSAWWEK